MKQILLFCSLSFLILFNACQKDSEGVLAPKEMQAEHLQLSSQDLISSLHPADKEMEQFFDKLTDAEFKDENESLIRKFGLPVFNQAMVTRGDEGAFSMAIPVYSKNKVTAMLLYLTAEGHDEMSIVSASIIKEVLVGSYEHEDDLIKIAISNLQNLLVIRGARIDEELNAYVKNTLLSDDLSSDSRNYEVITWFITGYYEGEVFIETNREITGVQFVACKPTFSDTGIGGIGTGGIVSGDIGFEGGGHGGEPTDGPVTTTSVLILSEDIADCVLSHLSNEALQFIMNNPVVDPCTNRSASDVYHDILLTLCEEINSTDLGDFTIEEWEEFQGSNEITVEDIAAKLEGLEGLMTQTDFEAYGTDLENLCCDNISTEDELVYTVDNDYSSETFKVYRRTTCCEKDGETELISCTYYDNGYTEIPDLDHPDYGTYQEANWSFNISGNLISVHETVTENDGTKWKGVRNGTAVLSACVCN